MNNKFVIPRKLFPILLIQIIFFPFLLVTPQVKAATEEFCPEALPQKLDRLMTASEKESRWGILIQPLLSERILYQRNAEKLFIPASNVKLFTSAIALNQLHPEFKIVTPVYTEGDSPHLKKLKIIGQGDPSLRTSDLEKLAATLSKNNVSSIETLVLQSGYFSQPRINSTWEWEDVYAAYGTGVNDFILDENAVTLTLRPQSIGKAVIADWNNNIAAAQWNLNNQATTAPANTDYRIQLQGKLGTSQLNLTGKLPQNIKTDVWQLAIPQPDRYFRDTLLNALAERGITINQVQFSDSEIRIPPNPPIIGGNNHVSFISPPLKELIVEINQNSNNLYAEALLKTLMARSGEEIMTEELTRFGIPPNHYQLVDGSGLSRRNLVTPSAIVQLLKTMSNGENAATFRSSLAVAGINGTLKNRLQSTVLQGNLQAKTGTLTGISARSGYVNPPNYQPLVFSILLNHSQVSPSQQRDMIDRILLLLSRLKTCQDRSRLGGGNETQQQQGSLPCCSMIKLDHERRKIRWKLAFPKKQKIKSIALG